MTEKTSTIKYLWISLFLLIPVLSLASLSDNFTQDNIIKILYSGLLSSIGGLIGYSFYYIVKTKKTITKTFALILLIILSLVIVFLISKVKYQTCEICGYIAVDKKINECNVCGNDTWEKELTNGKETDKYRWLSDEQLFWFEIDSLNQPINFYTPIIKDNYPKDKTWQPNITEKDLAEKYLEKTQKNND